MIHSSGHLHVSCVVSLELMLWTGCGRDEAINDNLSMTEP